MGIASRGRGTFMIRFGYIFRFVLGVRFVFEWTIFTPLIVIEFVVFIEWDVGAYFYVNIGTKKKASIIADNLLNYGKDVRFAIGPVPVLCDHILKYLLYSQVLKNHSGEVLNVDIMNDLN